MKYSSQKHSNAFAYGLVERGYKKGDSFMILTENKHTSETVVAQLGCFKAQVTVIPNVFEGTEKLESSLVKSKCKGHNKIISGILFSPSTTFSDEKLGQSLKNIFPSLERTGEQTKIKTLQDLIHTGFYTFSGGLKYKVES